MKKDTKPFGGSIFRSIMSSYIIICGIILLGTMVGYLYNYRVLNNNTASLASQKAEITAANLDIEFGQLSASMANIAADRDLLKTLEYSESMMGSQIHELSELRNLIMDNIHRSTIKEAYVYYIDTHSIFSTQSRYWNSAVIDSYIKSLGMTPEDFARIMDFVGIQGGHIFSDGRIWIMNNVYDDHYKKKAVIVFECLMNEIDIGEAPGNVTILSDGVNDVYVSDQERTDAGEEVLAAPENMGFTSRGYYYAGARLKSAPWICFVGTPRSQLYRPIRIFWIIFIIELVGAIAIMLFMSFRSTNKLWKPLQGLLDVINEEEDTGFMETFRSINDKVSTIMSENSLMHRNVTQLEPYMYENRIRRVFDGDISSEKAVSKTFSEFTEIPEGNPWSMIVVRPRDERQGAISGEKGTISPDKTGEDIMSFTLKNVIDELLGTNDSRVYKYEKDYLVFIKAVKDADRRGLEHKLEELHVFYNQTLKEPIYLLLGEVYESFQNVRDIYMELRTELEYRIFWREGPDSEDVWVMRKEQSEDDMVDFDEYSGTVRMMLNCLETGNFKEAYQMMDTYLDRAFPHNRRYLRQNNYRMYGLAAILTMSISYRMEKADKEFLEGLNYEERLMAVGSMEELKATSKEIFSSIIEYVEKKEKDGIPAWMDDVQVYIQEHYTEQGFSVSGIADEYGFTVSHLSRTFKSVMGVGLLEYIQKLRVDKAKELLNAGASVNDAAVGSGYLDAKALTRTFKRYEGITPGAYRDSKK